MDYFCLIYPDAVFNGTANHVVEQLTRAGVRLEDRVVRKLTLEEARTIFYARRHNADFDKFCKVMSSSNVWLLYLKVDEPLSQLLRRAIHPALHEEFYIPETDEDNAEFLKLITSAIESKKELLNIVNSLRERINLQEQGEDYMFTAYALRQGKRLYAYYTAMLVCGFDGNQAFNLALNAQAFFNDKELEGLLPEDDDIDNDDDLMNGPNDLPDTEDLEE